MRRLRAHHAAALLEAAVERLRARANRGAAISAWIRAVLLHHTAYLMAAPGVLPILASLSQVRGSVPRSCGRVAERCRSRASSRSPPSHLTVLPGLARLFYSSSMHATVGAHSISMLTVQPAPQSNRWGLPWHMRRAVTQCVCCGAQTIETRTALLKPLAALAGRLDLLVAHLPREPSSRAAAEQPALGGPQACSPPQTCVA